MGSILERFRSWRRRARGRRSAGALLEGLFRDPALLAGTSLRRDHAGRWVYLGHEEVDGRVVRVRFGILRHPRPYAFSRQSHKVIERYVFDVAARRVSQEGGVNLTRGEGRDAD